MRHLLVVAHKHSLPFLQLSAIPERTFNFFLGEAQPICQYPAQIPFGHFYFLLLFYFSAKPHFHKLLFYNFLNVTFQDLTPKTSFSLAWIHLKV